MKRRIIGAGLAVATLAAGALGVQLIAGQAADASATYKASADLNGRSGPSLDASVVKVNMYRAGSKVRVTCQINGGQAYGSTIWDKTSDGVYVTDAYVKTGHSGFVPGMKRCASDSGSGSGSSGKSRAFTAKTDLNGRRSKTTSAATVKTYKSGSTVHVTCQAYGHYAYGSAIWDKTTDQLWVTDAYVKTGYSGFVPGMKRCDNDQPVGSPGGGSGGTSGCPTGHGRINGPAGSTGGTDAQRIERVIAAARAQTTRGLSYAWGGGGKGGPSCGVSSPSPGGYHDYNRFGFDCSGYTEYAFWAGAGVDIGSNSNTQSLTHVSKAKRVTIHRQSDLKRGDLIFWGSPGHTDHVAIYLGGGKMLEAAPPRGSHSVHETSVYGSHSYAVRVF